MKIGIIYNLSTELRKGKRIEKLADEEAYTTAKAIKRILDKKLHNATLINFVGTKIESLKQYDILFNLAESTIGSPFSEYEIAEALENNVIPFTGCPSSALQLCLDKEQTKKQLLESGIPTPRYKVVKSVEDLDNADLSFPMIVKPMCEDASIGITDDSVVPDKSSLLRKVKEVLEVYKEPALVEEYIDGREINAAIIGNDEEATVLPLSEIIFTMGNGSPKILSFEAKWITDSDAYRNTVGSCPAKLDKATEERIRKVALASFRIMGCRDYARVDFRLKDGIPYVLEVNPNPCINQEGSGFVRSAGAAGYHYEALIEKLLEVASIRNNLTQLELVRQA